MPTSRNTIEAMRPGAADHLANPIERADLKARLARTLSGAAATHTPPAGVSEPDELIGFSTPMREVQKTVGLLADRSPDPK